MEVCRVNKEENYRNLAGNITAFTDNTMFYEDWLVIQQYVDDWLDEIDKLQQENQKYKEVIFKIKMIMLYIIPYFRINTFLLKNIIYTWNC